MISHHFEYNYYFFPK
uniref:Uncharacterized protein n=1 Tax=Arundo donax TaxID=35708 RepID=A0A0A8YQ74_ARUDO